MANSAPVITAGPADTTHELGEGAIAIAMTATDADLDTLAISFSSGNTVLDACCSVSDQGSNNYNVDCNCNDLALVNGDNDVVYTVTLVANDGTDNSAADTFLLTITSPNKIPAFYNLNSAITVDTNTNPFLLDLTYRDANTGDTLVFIGNIVNPTELATLTSSTDTGDSVNGGYKLGGR